jgi:hypothetical protein
MKRLMLPTKRPFNARAYLILVALLVPAELAILPYSLSLSDAEPPGFSVLILSAGIDLLFLAALAAAGLLLASRIGLGMPLIEGWTKRKPLWNRLPGVAGISILAGVLLPLILVLDNACAPFVTQITEMQAERTTANVIDAPAWQGFLAAFSAGITEETMFRLFGLTLITWLGSLVFRSRTGRPAPWLLWAANILFALLFGVAHLPAASQTGIPLDAVVVIRTLIINGTGGVMFGWLYWSFGLESAILAHVSADVVVHGFVPLVAQQADTIRSIIAGVVVVLVTVLTVLWSVHSIIQDRRRFSQSEELVGPLMEVDFSHPAV